MKELCYDFDQQRYCARLLGEPDKAEMFVLLLPTWEGYSQFMLDIAARYVKALPCSIMIADLYGDGIFVSDIAECERRMNAVLQQRDKIPQLIEKVADVFSDASGHDKNYFNQRLIISGYCFGGLCALDAVRAGIDARLALSFHGLLHPPDAEVKKLSDKYQGQLAVYHGYKDPMVDPMALAAFESEMHEADISMQLLAFSHTFHAFTNPEANVKGVAEYSQRADNASWNHAMHLITECINT